MTTVRHLVGTTTALQCGPRSTSVADQNGNGFENNTLDTAERFRGKLERVVHRKQKMKVRTLDHMQTKQLGNSDLFITPVGFGSWAIGGSGWQFAWGKQNDDDSVAAIHRALELGVNWIDTAAVYGLGHSEEIVARALETWTGPRP